MGQRLQSCFERLQSQFLTEVTEPGGARTLAARLNLALVACGPLHLRCLVFGVIQLLIVLASARTLAARPDLALVACGPLHLRFLSFEVIQFLIVLASARIAAVRFDVRPVDVRPCDPFAAER